MQAINNFDELFRKVFGEFAVRNNLLIENNIDGVVLYGNKLSIVFYMEHTIVYAEIVNPLLPKERYSLKVIYGALFGKVIEVVNVNNVEDKIYRQLLSYRDLLEGDLSFIMDGKFSWIEEYNKFSFTQRTLQEAVSKLPKDHPIYLKYQNGDRTWRDDLLKIL